MMSEQNSGIGISYEEMRAKIEAIIPGAFQEPEEREAFRDFLHKLNPDQPRITKVVHVSGEVEIAETAIDVNGRYLFVFTGMSQAQADEVLRAIDQVKAGDGDRVGVSLPYDGKLQIYPIVDPPMSLMKNITQEQWDQAMSEYKSSKRHATMIASSSPYLQIVPDPHHSELVAQLEKMVNEHQEFFGNPPAGEWALEVALGKLAQLIEENGHDRN